MKRLLLLLLLLAGLIASPLHAQDAATASDIADRQAAEERYKRMSADIESMIAANLVLQKKVSALENEVQKLREEQSRAAANDTSTESIKRLAESVQEVDKKREADKDLILDKISDLRKVLSAAPTGSAAHTTSKISVPDSTPSSPQKGFEHVVQSGDTLSGITLDYNAAFKSKGMKTITQKQVMDANPNVAWNRLKIGQKIFVPAP